MDWKTYYNEHIVTAEEAVSKIKSGDRVAVGHACSEPPHLVEAMAANAKAYRNVGITHMVAMGKAEYCNPEYAENFIHNAIFVGASTRKAIAEKFGEEAAAKIRIQYGGSMKGSNVKGLMAQPEIDGGLIGGASLKAADFAQVVNFL
jgi:4-hydroxybutyrate CoA-transferase